MQRYVLHSHKLYSIKIIHNFYQNLSWVPCCIYFLGVNSGKSRSRQHALNGRLRFMIITLVTGPPLPHEAGGLVVTLWPITLAIRVRFPVGAVRRKSVRVLRWFFISRLPSPKPDTGVYKRDSWRRANYLCSHGFLWPGTIKSWWKPNPGQADQLLTLQHSPHKYIHKWREGTTGLYIYSAPKKIVGAMTETFSLKEGRPGDNSNTDVGQWVPQISKINTANKSVESCRVPNRKRKRTRFVPMVKHLSESKYICMVETRITEKRFFVTLGFLGYLVTIG